jgi:hypothetical protein
VDGVAISVSHSRVSLQNHVERSSLPGHSHFHSPQASLAHSPQAQALPILIHLHRFGHQLVELTNAGRARRVSG